MGTMSYILITGASSGIGREIAIRLSSRYNVIINGRDNDRLLETLASCSKSNHHLIWRYDFSEVVALEDSITAFMLKNECVITDFIHSAGYMKTIPLRMIDVDLFQSMFNINTISAAMIVKVLIKKKVNQGMLKNIVLISSNISNFGAKAFSAYAASKAASDGLMRCLAVELAPSVRVNSVLPGSVRTNMTEHMYEDIDLIKRMSKTYPLGLGTVKNICDAVKFLLSDDAQWITGQQLVVDGGRTINITG
jgi:NAD(P)-dependent dehydrogenase (short-subunit alcohol dehydrogenase family)